MDVYPSVSTYFDIDYRAGEIVLAGKSYVGLIPVNDRVAVHVVPRFPISNLFYILQRADARLRFLAGFDRAYELLAQTEQNPASIFGNRLLEMLTHIRREGLLRRYQSRDRSDTIEGALLLSETVSRFRSQGVKHRQVRRVTELTPDITENRLIKSAIEKLASYYANAGGGDAANGRAATAEALVMLFDRISGLSEQPGSVQSALPSLIRRLPPVHMRYAALLWLSYLIEFRRGLAVERVGQVNFDTFVVNLADVFEDYVRQLVIEELGRLIPHARVRNGNFHQVSLFRQGSDVKVKPDIYVIEVDRPILVLDAKYKPQIKPADRYEVLAFCEALQVKTAIVIAPAIGGPETELIGRTAGGVALHILRIDLGAADLKSAETAFASGLGETIRALKASGG